MEAKQLIVPWLAQTAGDSIEIHGYKRIVAVVQGSDDEAIDIARLIQSAPTIHQKLTDTVAWLDREIAYLITCEMDNSLLGKLEELRDDLAETLRKIKEGI